MTRMKLIKNIQIYAPKNLGVKDVLISDSKIEKLMIISKFLIQLKQLMAQDAF